MDSFGGKGNQDGRLNMPVSIAISSDGLIYIADEIIFGLLSLMKIPAHMLNLDFKSKNLKPQLLRISGQTLYFLANNSAIYKMSLDDDKNLKLLVSANRISTFDVLYENRIGYIDGLTQQLNVIYNNNTEHQYFTKNANGIFRFARNYELIRYNPTDNNLYICDKMAVNTTTYFLLQSQETPDHTFYSKSE